MRYRPGSDPEEKLNREKVVWTKVYIRENGNGRRIKQLCVSKIELPCYSVEFYKKICVYCGISGTSRVLGNSVKLYPKCTNCSEKPDVQRWKRKALVTNDLGKKKK